MSHSASQFATEIPVNKVRVMIQIRGPADNLTPFISTYSKLLASFCAID
ncbi:MAG TPA: hypothetical protein VGH08_02220 [Chthoniobacterales bacterium]